MVTAYIQNIIQLVQMNNTGLLPSLKATVILYFNIILPAVILAALLVWMQSSHIVAAVKSRRICDFGARARLVINSHPAWLVSCTIGAIVFESQNTGSLEFVFAWPILLALVAQHWPPNSSMRTTILILACAVVLPTAINILQRNVRLAGVLLTYTKVDAGELAKIDQILIKPMYLERAKAKQKHYPKAYELYRKLASDKIFYSRNLYAEPAFQFNWMVAATETTRALKALEAKSGVRLEKLVAIDFVNPFSFVLKREPVKYISIGMSEGRTVPPLNRQRLAALHAADGLLQPRCPVTPTQIKILEVFAPVVQQRVRLTLSPCWELFVKPEPAARLL